MSQSQHFVLTQSQPRPELLLTLSNSGYFLALSFNGEIRTWKSEWSRIFASASAEWENVSGTEKGSFGSGQKKWRLWWYLRTSRGVNRAFGAFLYSWLARINATMVTLDTEQKPERQHCGRRMCAICRRIRRDKGNFPWFFKEIFCLKIYAIFTWIQQFLKRKSWILLRFQSRNCRRIGRKISPHFLWAFIDFKSVIVYNVVLNVNS